MANAKSFVVQHTMVGVHAAGDVVTFTEEQIKKGGIDVERLLHLGAIREAKDDEAKGAVEYGKNVEGPALFPAVPFEATNVAPAHQEITQDPHPELRETPSSKPFTKKF